MSDPQGQAEATDSELNVKAIVYVGVGTVVITIVSMILVWWLFQGFRKLEERQDPKPSALPEAAERQVPPSPRLEISPPENLKELREREATVLDAPAWIDQAQGKIRLPIDLALDVVARRGLGEAAPAEPAPAGGETAAPAGSPATAPAASAPANAPAPPAGGAH
jgi:hypothetical protein